MAPENAQYVREIVEGIDNIGKKFLTVRDSLESNFVEAYEEGFSGLRDFTEFQSFSLDYLYKGTELSLNQEFYTVGVLGIKGHLVLNQLVGIPLSKFPFLNESEMKAIGVEVFNCSDGDKIKGEDLYKALVQNSNCCLAYENVNKGEYCIHFLLQADVDKEDNGFEYVERLQRYEIDQISDLPK